MKWFGNKIAATQQISEYASRADFQDVFTTHMPQLYLLALLLVGDEVKAEQCFVGAIEDCLTRNLVFKEWVYSCSRRLVVRRAIQMSLPIQQDFHEDQVRTQAAVSPATDRWVTDILRLPLFERFVYVLSVLERYSDRECSVSLVCTPQQVIAARTRAMQRIAEFNKHTSAHLHRQPYQPETRDVVASEEIPQMQGATRNGQDSEDDSLRR
jgi:DNA-directed RNA polymerase specialized sigma24 family protein